MNDWTAKFDALLENPPEDRYTILAEALGLVKSNGYSSRVLNIPLLEAKYGTASSGERRLLACAVSMWSRDMDPELSADYPIGLSDIAALDDEWRMRIYKAIEATQG